MADIANQVIVKARTGRAQRLVAGEAMRVINIHGTQCIDTWALDAEDDAEHMSMEHTRAELDRMMPAVGQAFLTNRRRPILTIVEDTSPGIHDTLNAPCDVHRYALMGCRGYHDNCTDNFATALGDIGITEVPVPCPFNMFSNRPWDATGKLWKEPPASQPGDSMTLRAERDCIVILSACPQDMNPTNGADRTPKDIAYEVLAP